MSDFLCSSGHLFDEPRSYTEVLDPAMSSATQTYSECPVCGDSGFEEFSVPWGIAVLKTLWSEFMRGEHYELVVGLMGDLIQQLHDVEVG